jgi:hypothetical protein
MQGWLPTRCAKNEASMTCSAVYNQLSHVENAKWNVPINISALGLAQTQDYCQVRDT